MPNPSRALALYGTEEEVPAPKRLGAGKLTAELEAGNLRYIRWDGEEVLRAISFIVRDRDWGTYAPQINDLKVEETAERFTVTLSATAIGEGEEFSYTAKIEGRADGVLTFHGAGMSATGFETNRTGFVILHPIDGVSGAPVTIEHTDGHTVESFFPELIDPIQPMMDLRALTHRTPGGLTVKVLMEGDTYEMEDQRNWTDASYKTYVRPLARPWPYGISPDERIDQTITVTICGHSAASQGSGPIALKPGAPMRDTPEVGIGLRPEDTHTTSEALGGLRALGTHFIVLHHDPRQGHDADTLKAMLEVAHAVGAAPWLEAVIVQTRDNEAQREVAALGALAQSLGNPFATVLVSPAPDLKCTLPGSVWPETPDAKALYKATRAAFPNARIGGGMFSYFTELNRKRPPTDALDLVSFTTCPMVHAGDDRSVMESREAHAAIAASVTALSEGKPWAVGPSAIGMRDNPYGAAAKDNPGNIRQAMNRNDPRQRGLMGAAWCLGYLADFAEGGAQSVALGGATGPFGVISSPSDDPEPWFEGKGELYPAFHVLRGVGRLRGQRLLTLHLPASGPVAALAVETEGGQEIWAANTTPEPVQIALPGAADLAVLDASNFAAAASNPDFFNATANHQGTLSLDSFAIARILLKG